jgi:glyoxylase-like metal-dependent hydrolase (beta-lactamase superfamily II)
VDVLLEDGEELTVGCVRVRCLAAPGHTEGLVVFEISLDGERLWFTSDLFEAKHAHSWVNLPWTGSLDFDRGKYITSFSQAAETALVRPCIAGTWTSSYRKWQAPPGDGLHGSSPEVEIES